VGVVVCICNPSRWEAEARGSLVQGKFGIHSEILSPKKEIRTEGRKEGRKEGKKERKEGGRKRREGGRRKERKKEGKKEEER
jgi:hypothetical protein